MGGRGAGAAAAHHGRDRTGPQGRLLQQLSGPSLRPVAESLPRREHGCVYCYARPSHAWLGLSPGLDFETRLIAKPNAPEALGAGASRPSYKPRTIVIGANTDAYQPIEGSRGITRECLRALRDFRHPVAVITKGALIERDIDLLGEMASMDLVRVASR